MAIAGWGDDLAVAGCGGENCGVEQKEYGAAAAAVHEPNYIEENWDKMLGQKMVQVAKGAIPGVDKFRCSNGVDVIDHH